MPTVYRPNRKASDEDIIRLNSVGLSLQTIGRILGVHHSCVSDRLKLLNIPRADTRRSFMEEILAQLTNEQQWWLVEEVEKGRAIRIVIRDLIVEKYNQTKGII